MAGNANEIKPPTGHPSTKRRRETGISDVAIKGTAASLWRGNQFGRASLTKAGFVTASEQGAAMGKATLRCVGFKPVHRGPLVGFASISYDDLKMIVHKIGIQCSGCQGGGEQTNSEIRMPARPTAQACDRRRAWSRHRHQ